MMDYAGLDDATRGTTHLRSTDVDGVAVYRQSLPVPA